MIGQTLGHYKILAKLGEGGMGVVYRAHDEVLNRDVALKLLSHSAVDKVAPGHLLREAQTASSLSHPNICTIHQVGEIDSDFYVVMELTLSYDSLESKLVGTLPYLAPEVLRGQKGDHQSDLWALGVLLYELAAGELPFHGNTGFEVTSAILREATPPLPSSVPPGLASVIQRCLSKERLERYQCAGEVRVTLEAVQGACCKAGDHRMKRAGRGCWCCAGWNTSPSKTAMCSCWSAQTKARSCCGRRVTGPSGTSPGPIFTGRAFMRWPTMGEMGGTVLWVSTNNMVWGTFLRSSDDFGRTWTNPVESNLRFPAESDASLKNIWQISLGRNDEPEKLYLNEISLHKFANQVGTEGTVLYNSAKLPDGFPALATHVFCIPAADKLGTTKVTNMVMLGGLLELTRALPRETGFSVLKAKVRNEKLLELDCQAIDAGMECVRQRMNAVSAGAAERDIALAIASSQLQAN